jgi:ATP-binding cassette, subfamily C, bacterial LapB
MNAASSHFSILRDRLRLGLQLPEPWRKRAFRLAAGWHLAIALMLNIFSLTLPIMMLQIYDRIIPRQAFGTLTMLILCVSVALLLEACLRGARAWLTAWTAASNEHAYTCAALERFCNTDLRQFEASGPGAHLQRLSAISRLREFYSGQTLTALIDLPFAVLFLAMIAYFGEWLVLVPLTLLIVFGLLARQAGKSLKTRLQLRSGNDDRKSNFLISTLTGIHTVKAMGMEKLLLRRFEEHQSDITRSSYLVARARGFASTLSAAFSQLSQVVTAAVGCLLVLNGNLSMGGLSACTLLAGRALQPVQRVMGTWLRLQDFTVSRDHAAAIFALPVRQRIEEPLPLPKGRLAVTNISFGFGPETPLLQNASLEAEPGEVIAITGERGAGKSTLLQVIAGVLAPQSGSVRIDGMDTALHAMADLYAHVGYLPQQGTIFKGTILENLTGFQTRDDCIAMAKHMGTELGLDAVVNLLPAGYATMLDGSTADPIPPGIKQRIALARVLTNLPAVLLFDDADRALDKEGYNCLFRLVGRFKRHRTIVMVSQDWNLLSFADKSYHLEGGRLTAVRAGATQHLSLLVPPLKAGAT